jgi:hypothetical protein
MIKQMKKKGRRRKRRGRSMRRTRTSKTGRRASPRLHRCAISLVQLQDKVVNWGMFELGAGYLATMIQTQDMSAKLVLPFQLLW